MSNDGPQLVVKPEELANLDDSPSKMAGIPGSRMFEIKEALAVFEEDGPGPGDLRRQPGRRWGQPAGGSRRNSSKRPTGSRWSTAPVMTSPSARRSSGRRWWRTTGSSTRPQGGDLRTCSPDRAAVTSLIKAYDAGPVSRPQSSRRFCRRIASSVDLLQLGPLRHRSQCRAGPRKRERRLGADAGIHPRLRRYRCFFRRPQDFHARDHQPRQPDRPQHAGGTADRARPLQLSPLAYPTSSSTGSTTG